MTSETLERRPGSGYVSGSSGPALAISREKATRQQWPGDALAGGGSAVRAVGRRVCARTAPAWLRVAHRDLLTALHSPCTPHPSALPPILPDCTLLDPRSCRVYPEVEKAGGNARNLGISLPGLGAPRELVRVFSLVPPGEHVQNCRARCCPAPGAWRPASGCKV